MSTKKYATTLTTKTTSPQSATIAKLKEKPFCTHSVSAQTNTRYGKHFFHIIMTLNSAPKMTSTNCLMILNALVKEKKVKKLLLTLHTTILNEIWKARNLLKHQKRSVTNDVIIKKSNTKLRKIIWVNFQKHLRQESLETFNKNFCIKGTLCSVISNDLTICLYESKKIHCLCT